MTTHFEEGVNALQSRLVEMGTLAKEMIALAIKGLVERKEDPTHILSNEEKVNNLQIEVDELTLKLIALMQPTASDLRFIALSMKISGELERIGDQAINIFENSRSLIREPQLKPLIDLPRMAEISQDMVKNSIWAYVKKDAILAESILVEDTKVDNLRDRIFEELLGYMTKDSSTVPRAMSLILISRNLERIADHATNIAEEVIYIFKGRDVRHHKF